MKLYILTRVSAEDHTPRVISVEDAIEYEEQAYLQTYDHLLDDIHKREDPYTQTVLIDKHTVHVYIRDGYITNHKSLKYIYTVELFEDEESDNNEMMH